MNQPTPTIILTGGGSGGHITPLLSLAHELKKRSPDCQIVYIGYKGDNFDTFKQSGHDFDFMAFIKAGKLRRYHGYGLGGLFHPKTLALNIRDMFRVPASTIAAYKILRRFNADVVLSKGSFVSVPVGLAAKFRGVPIVTHDSDSTPGLANKIVGRWATVHTTGQPVNNYPYKASSTVQVGIPLDERIKKVTPKLQSTAKAKLGLPLSSAVLLVSGGGNGSQRLNDLTTAIAPELLKTNLTLYIIHLTGAKHESEVKAVYKSLGKSEHQRIIIKPFSPDFYSLVAAADIVLTRAGATTLAELAAAGKACVVIPATFLSGGHQTKNADELTKNDAAIVLQNETTPDELLAVINSLLTNDSRRFELARNLYSTAKTDASAKLAKIILNAANNS